MFCEHEPADIKKFKQAGWRATKAQKSLDAGILEIRQRLSIDEADRPGLLISNRCGHLIREFHGYKKGHVGTAAAEDHCCDSLRYALMGADQAERLRPREMSKLNDTGVYTIPGAHSRF